MTTTLTRRSAKRATRPVAKPAPAANPVADMRERAIAFLATQTGPIDCGPIRAHLKLDPVAWLPLLNQALTSKRITVTRYHPRIGTLPGGGALYGATPCKLYALTRAC